MNCHGHSLNRIRTTEVRPTVPSGTLHHNSKPSATKCLMSDPVQSSTINGNKFAIPAAPWRTVKQKSHAAQIPFSFFPDGSHPNDRTPESNPSVLRSSQCPKEGHDSGTIIRDTRQE